MLTDDDARRLLHLAGDTVEVAPAGPLPAPPMRPWWPALAAAAAIVLVAALLAVTLPGGGRTPEPAPPPPDDGRFRLGPDQVPSVFGLTAEQAVDRLQDLGLRGTIATVASCRDLPGRALGTRPATGTLVDPGTSVTVTTAAPDAGCLGRDLGPDREAAWRFLDFARGRGDAPPLAGEVAVYVGDDRTTLSRTEASNPQSWPGLDIVRRAVGEVQRWSSDGSTVYQTPGLGTQIGPGGCGPRPQELRGRRGLVLWVGIPTDGVHLFGTCTAVTLFRNPAGALDAVLVSDVHAPGDVPGPPDVVGDSAAYARDRLEAAGYGVDEVARPDCGQVGTVAAQTPAWGDEVEPGVTVTIGVVDRQTGCDSSAFVVPTPLTEAADDLVAFARGDGPAPTVASQVELYVADGLWATLTPEEAADPTAWGEVLERLTGPVAQSEGAGVGQDSCLVRGELPDGLSSSAAWRLSVPEPRGCGDDWSVLVWVDDDGAIRAVDLLTGRS
ncbi:PASTA domain-containing protein [Nocardioides sp. T2.26MG-1]|uniref:PASTA domain-containing protein n=1 Tax=Nocardioides sp. T2.26MG-1 TaxID=3041166 RepID=UPI002477BFE1|nr:PASTA domain-containing protein [Nocardioides sp. T2.26MG-1]CAI9412035.1 hypothetical protein HIDPHFAB_01668 [Nocardioides sp. T2.26MG-1]